MPLYEYEPDAGHCDYCRDRFEVLQRLSEPALTACPDCGQPCHRVFSSFASIKSTRDMLSTKNLAKNGFTQYKKARRWALREDVRRRSECDQSAIEERVQKPLLPLGEGWDEGPRSGWFPLTPALSRRERENHRPYARLATSLFMKASPSTAS